MDFFTKIDIPAADFKIDYTSRLAFFGSCFADNISAQFAERKFHVLVNPFGTVYNPVSLAGQIKAIADGKIFGELSGHAMRRPLALLGCARFAFGKLPQRMHRQAKQRLRPGARILATSRHRIHHHRLCIRLFT